MSDDAPAFELEEFEQVAAIPGTALLRIVAKSASIRAGPAMALLLDGGDEVHRLAPLPAPTDPPGQLRVGFSASERILRATRGFTLLLPNGATLPLPNPRRRQRATVQAIQRADAAAEHDRVQAPESSMLALESLLAEHGAVLAARIQAEQDAAQLQQEVGHVRAAAEVADAAGARARAQAAEAQENSKRIGATRSELQEQLDEVRMAAASLQGGMVEAEARSEALAEIVRLETEERERAERHLAQRAAQAAELKRSLRSALTDLGAALSARQQAEETLAALGPGGAGGRASG